MSRGQTQCIIPPRDVGGQDAQLQAETFTEVACADSGRVHVLQVLKGGLDLFRLEFLEFVGQGRVNVIEALCQVAILVEIVDQRGHQGAVTF
jgi:hypothetical protein